MKISKPFTLIAMLFAALEFGAYADHLDLALTIDGDCAVPPTAGTCLDVKLGAETLLTFHSAPDPSRSIGTVFTSCRPPMAAPDFDVCAPHSGLVPPQFNACIVSEAVCQRPCADECIEGCGGDPVCEATCLEGHADMFAHEGTALTVLRATGRRVKFRVVSTLASWHGGAANCPQAFSFPVTITWTVVASESTTFLLAELAVTIPAEMDRQIPVARPLPFFEVLQETFSDVHWVAPDGNWAWVPVPDPGPVAFVDREPLDPTRRTAVTTRIPDAYSVGIFACPDLEITSARPLVVSAFTEQNTQPNLYLHPEPTHLDEGQGLDATGHLVFAISRSANEEDLATAMEAECALVIFDDGFESGDLTEWPVSFPEPDYGRLDL